MAKCSVCNGWADEEDKCYGCGNYICEKCDEECGILGPHELMDHFNKAKAKAKDQK